MVILRGFKVISVIFRDFQGYFGDFQGIWVILVISWLFFVTLKVFGTILIILRFSGGILVIFIEFGEFVFVILEVS